MCGIAGLVVFPAQEIQKEIVEELLDRLQHRGPDDRGVLIFGRDGVKAAPLITESVEGEVLLVHHRLSILDLSKAGWQPMSSQCKRYHIVFNGEIYNYLELRAELEAHGHIFHSHSDTEVLLTAYSHWGVECLNRLVGMFAFAILDTQERKLFLARDFFGIKPLYYTLWQGGFAFASEIHPLLDFPGVSRKVNPQRLYDYLRFGLTDRGGETLLADIKQLSAAHYLEIKLDNPMPIEPLCYWQVDLNKRADLSFDEAANRLRELFLESIRLHLRSDVPIGTALSGGIDSSAIVMAMRYLEPSLEIHTFSYIASDPALSEERYVDIVGKSAHAVMHKVQLESRELVADFKYLIQAQGEPFGSTSIYAQHRVFGLAREAGIKVMLDGQGADEILGGYICYKGARLASLLKQNRWAEAYQFMRVASATPGMGSWLLWQWAINYMLPTQIQVLGRQLVGKDLNPPWLNTSWFKERNTSPSLFDYTGNKTVLRESLYDSLRETLPSLLRYEDRNSMAFSIESRVPFLTPALVSFMFALPEEYIVSPDGTSKAVFRRAMKEIVPNSILDRKDKIGFATPEFSWLNSLKPWVEYTLRSEVAAQIPALNCKKLEQEWNLILTGKRLFNFNAWKWLNLIEWSSQFEVIYE
ncbi:MAG TPA: asparagine synthase (glutamine-hydrolyzing) [Cyanobacteria bacterium UBA8803]|nr:asparagine synthase (glutamine-hydrolyzing) [Cyanobacteria bacterium UBA9273]HBL61188.1 asparagine synthase (glutamine-hydrolyzing) [Cyanobacteria bacterium UBA8803]